MIKRIITMLGMLAASQGLSNSQASNITPSEEDMKKEIQSACGHINDAAEFDFCVQIVEMEFTVVPHNTQSGGGTTPQGSSRQRTTL